MALESPETTTVNKILHSKMTRRGLIFGGIITGTTGAAVHIDNQIQKSKQTVMSVAEYALAPNPIPPLPKRDDKLIYPGWLVAGVKEPFISMPKGHVYFVRDAVLYNGNKILFNTAQDLGELLNEQISKGKRLPFGEALKFAIDRIDSRLTGVDKSLIDPATNRHTEAVMGALLTTSLIYTPWIKLSELKKAKVVPTKVPDETHVTDAIWSENGRGRLGYPRFFGIKKAYDKPGSEPKYGGQDRAMHVANHAVVTGIYLYSVFLGIESHKRIPRGAFAAIEVARISGAIQSPEKEAEFISSVSGWGHEFTALSKLRNWGLTAYKIHEGPFDDMFSADINANKFGALIGIELINRAHRNEPIQPVLQAIDKRQFTQYGTNPDIRASIKNP